MSKFKPLLNHPEELADARLAEVCTTVGARVFAKIRVADVLPINGSGASGDEFGFALRSHFDFVVADENKLPLFAVEVDGPQHATAEQKRRDAMKDALAERHGLPLLRVTLNHLKREFRGMPLITWFAEMLFMQRAMDDAAEAGQLPLEDCDPMWVYKLPGRRGTFPLMLGLDARDELRKLNDAGRIGFFNMFGGYDKAGNIAAVGCVLVRPATWAVARVAARQQQFPVVMSDLVFELLPIELLSTAKAVLAGDEPGLSATEVLDELTGFARRFRVSSMMTGPDFPRDGQPREDLSRLLNRGFRGLDESA